MEYELGVSAAAQFMQIHADAFAVLIDAKGDEAIEDGEEQVNEGQDKAEEGCDADELGEELSWPGSKDAGGEESPQTAGAVDGDGAGGIVDGDGELEKLDQEGREDAGDDSGEDGFEGGDEAGAGTRGDQTGEPSVGAEAGVWFAEADLGHGKCGGKRRGGGEKGVDRGDRENRWGGIEPEERSGHVGGKPADEGDETAEEDKGSVVAGNGGGEAFFGEFAAAGARDPNDGEGAESADYVNGGCAADVEKTCAEREVRAELREPAAAPDPMGNEGKDEGREKGGGSGAGDQAPAVGARAPGNENEEGDREQFKEQGKLSACGGLGETAERDGAGAGPVPGLSEEMEEMARAEISVGEGGPDQREENRCDGNHGQRA